MRVLAIAEAGTQTVMVTISNGITTPISVGSTVSQEIARADRVTDVSIENVGSRSVALFVDNESFPVSTTGLLFRMGTKLPAGAIFQNGQVTAIWGTGNYWDSTRNPKTQVFQSSGSLGGNESVTPTSPTNPTFSYTVPTRRIAYIQAAEVSLTLTQMGTGPGLGDIYLRIQSSAGPTFTSTVVRARRWLGAVGDSLAVPFGATGILLPGDLIDCTVTDAQPSAGSLDYVATLWIIEADSDLDVPAPVTRALISAFQIDTFQNDSYLTVQTI